MGLVNKLTKGIRMIQITKSKSPRLFIMALTVFLGMIPHGTGGPTGNASAAPETEGTNKEILVELFLSSDQKENLDAIKKELEAASLVRVKTQFFRAGYPPPNIAIGKNVPAATARLAIGLAIKYNRGVKYILPEERLSPDYLAIGTSIFDERIQKPISPADLDRLMSPHLSTPEFHTLYRSLTGEDKRLPS